MSENGNSNRFIDNQCLIRHMKKFIGENVLIFTTVGGAAGSGFEGILLSIECDFVRLLSEQGTSPNCPISPICDIPSGVYAQGSPYPKFKTGSICDIPFDKIVCFTHNAV